MARMAVLFLAILAGCSREVAPLRDNPAAKARKAPAPVESRAEALGLIEHEPGGERAGSWGARIPPSDGEGYRLGKALWLRHVARADAEAAVLANAVEFFQVADKALAEELLLRLEAREPGKGWKVRLGRLYFQILVGSNASMPLGVVRSVSEEEARGPLAMAVRKKLGASADGELLAVTGGALEDWGRGYGELGREYLDRAAALAPESKNVRLGLRMRRMRELAARGPLEARFAGLERLPEAERAIELGRLTEMAYRRGDTEEYYRHDGAKARESFDRAREWGERAVRGGSSSARYRGHVVLGLLAMREGKRGEAVWHMLASLEGKPGLDEEWAAEEGLGTRLAGWLLKDGERESVIQFLERLGGARNLEAAEWIRQGVKPLWYPG